MNSPVGMGGVLLVIAAVVWLMVFVPGWAKRGEIVAAAKNVNEQIKAERKLQQSSPQFRLNRLVMTQRIFSVLFLLLLFPSHDIQTFVFQSKGLCGQFLLYIPPYTSKFWPYYSPYYFSDV